MDGSQMQSIENIIDDTDPIERDFPFEDVGWLERKYKSLGNSSLGALVDLTEAASERGASAVRGLATWPGHARNTVTWARR
jgi:hypothetical protein